MEPSRAHQASLAAWNNKWNVYSRHKKAPIAFNFAMGTALGAVSRFFGREKSIRSAFINKTMSQQVSKLFLALVAGELRTVALSENSPVKSAPFPEKIYFIWRPALFCRLPHFRSTDSKQ